VKQIYAPWRMAYLEDGSPTSGCFFCALAEPSGVPDASRGVVWRGHNAFALLNAYPYTNGHVMVAPYEHAADLDRVPPETARELMIGVRLMLRALRSIYDPAGFNVGANLGSAAGAGFGDHLHLHVVPRWSGDTNFMTAVGHTRVIPEDLDVTAERLKQAVATLTGASEEPRKDQGETSP
jgi:ATP adenylyltransferase